jgi:hypothetical protein
VRGLGRLLWITALVWALVVPVAFAATEAGDAGELPLTAQDLGAEAALGEIGGSLGSDTDRDLYRVCLTGAGSFSATTVAGTTMDTQLFLLDSTGRGVYANDDAPGVIGQSTLPANDPLTPASAGAFYLGITRYNQDPVTSGGSRLFADVTFTTGPVSSAPTAVVASWTTGRTGAFGAYRIGLTGVVPCPLPDLTAPDVALRTPTDGAAYAHGEQVVADYDCTDEQGGSGVASCAGPVADGQALDTSSVGQHSFTVTARDQAGNERTLTHAYTVLDAEAPTVDLRTPADGATYPRGVSVLADYGCSDESGGSGVDTCVGTVPDGQPLDTATLGTKSFVVVARDEAGNEQSVTHAYTVVDATAPAIDLRTPVDGATYAVGDQVLADYDCSDEQGGSGLATCTGSLPDGQAIDTAEVGAHTFTVDATDVAGNASQRSVSYSVATEPDPDPGFAFDGFLRPLVNPPSVNVVRAGALVPVRFSLGGDQGDDVLADGFPRSGEVECGSGDDADVGVVEPTLTPRWWHRWWDGDLRYRRRHKIYSYLWKTDRDWAGSCRQLIVKLSDGSVHRANVEFPGRHRRHRWHH